MLRLVKVFVDLALWRITPANLPASWFLFAIVSAVVALLELLIGLLLPAANDRVLIRVALSVALPVVLTWAILSVTRRRQRFLQTVVALLGVGVLAELVLTPLHAVLGSMGVDHPAALPLSLLSLIGLVWYVLACAHIWRAALDVGLMIGIATSVGNVILSYALAKLILPGA